MKHIAALSFALLGLAPIAASAADDVMIVYDGSNSMWGQIEGVSKIEIARDVMAGLVETWPQSTNLGLLAYGHRREGDCTDIELMVEPGPVDRDAFLQAVNSITPRGRTPLTAAVEQAAEFLSYRDNPATVVLVSDGVETCQADPCALAAQLERQGVAFTAHVIGFDLSREEHEQLACIAENTGGIFVPAENADELRTAMTQVQATIESEPVVEPEPESEPEPAVEPETPAQTVSAPATVTFGTEFTVTWGETVHPRDWISIAPVGADAGTYTTYRRVESNDSVTLRAPAEPGHYEVRYVLDEGSRVLASTPVEVVVQPGARTIEISKPGHRTETRDIDAVAGARENYSFVLRRGGHQTWLPWTLLATGVVGLAAGGTLIGIDGNEIRSDCNPDPAGNCQFLHKTLGGGVALTVVGVGLVATGVVLAVKWRAKGQRGYAHRRPRLELTGAGVRGRF